MPAAEHARTFLVDALHLGEVGRRIGLAGEHRGHEVLLALLLKRPVETLLVAERAVRNRADALAARRPRAVSRPDLEPVGTRAEVLQRLVEAACADFHRAGDLGRALEQVGPADVADEHEVASGRAHRLAGRGLVGHQERQMLGRVAGGVQHLDVHAAHRDVVAVLDQRRACLSGEPVLPAFVTLTGQVETRAGALGQLAAARDVIGVDVRLGHVRHARALGLGRPNVLLDVAVRVDDQGLARLGTSDDVARLRQGRFEQTLEEHQDIVSRPRCPATA